MTNYMRNVEKFFYDKFEDDLEVTDENYHILNHTLMLMDMENEDDANSIIENDPELKKFFGHPDPENLFVLGDEEVSEWNTESESEFDELIQDEPPRKKPSERIFPDQQMIDAYAQSSYTNPRTHPTAYQDEAYSRRPNYYDSKDIPSFYDKKFKRSAFVGSMSGNMSGSVQTQFGLSLNIDCCGSAERKIKLDQWLNELNLMVQTNKEKFDTPKKVIILAEHKSTGVLQNFIKRTTWNVDEFSTSQMADILAEAVYANFLGIDFRQSLVREDEQIIKKAKEKMSKMTLCDICFLDSFFCEYESAFHSLKERDDFVKFIELYFAKIPIVGSKSLERYKSEKTVVLETSIAYADRITREEISKVCEFSKQQKRLKKFNKNCCAGLVEDQNLEFGCSISKSNRKKKSFSKKKKKKYYKKSYSKKRVRSKFQPRKFFRKKPPGKEKFCPKGKKSCRCWICSEQGHYANECPNRQAHQKQVNLFQEAIQRGLYPIEDPYEGEHHVYEFIVKEEPPDTDSETTSSDGSSSESSDSE
ncbi:ORF4 [Atractylodes mild mottle virus]|uniref:Coat protein n=1 Tax=Atractylodes mild mottle virus TaxID=1711685 RepID=A0A0M4JM78_9VIRU|nr:ORF4 [Atractylodes mild mottle virus]ALD49089.1 ORF4 [Atractylodes mild mottle virus]